MAILIIPNPEKLFTATETEFRLQSCVCQGCEKHQRCLLFGLFRIPNLKQINRFGAKCSIKE